MRLRYLHDFLRFDSILRDRLWFTSLHYLPVSDLDWPISCAVGRAPVADGLSSGDVNPRVVLGRVRGERKSWAPYNRQHGSVG